MTTKIELQQMRDRLAWELKQHDEAKAARVVAQTEYDKEIEAQVTALRERLESEKKDQVAALEAAKKREAAKAGEVARLRDLLKNDLDAYTEYEDRNDKKPLEGLSRRDSLVPYIRNEQTFFQECLRHAPFLLTVDQKAVEKLVKAFAVEQKSIGGYILPHELESTLTQLDVRMEHTWTISDKTLLKDAPDSEPATHTPDKPSFVAPTGDPEIPF